MTTPLLDATVSTNKPFTADHVPAALWHDLMRGRARVANHAFSDGWMSLRVVTIHESVVPSERARSILLETFAARAQKVVGIQRGIAPSTVTAALRRALQDIGFQQAPSRVPLLLAIAAEASLMGAGVPGALCSEQQEGDDRYTTLLLHDPIAWLAVRLSACEASVTRLRLHGVSLEAIAELRHRSVRTVANQLAVAYRKLGVGGRSDLLALLIAEYLKGNVPLPPPANMPHRCSLLMPGSDDAQELFGAERSVVGLA